MCFWYEKRQLVIKSKHKQLQNMWYYPAINTPAEGVVVFEGGVVIHYRNDPIY
jgi:hypothetical protein